MKGEVDADEARAILRTRDRRMWLEMESSSLAGILIRPLLAACPDKKFILTMRDPFSWCDSWLDHNINSPPSDSSPWALLDNVRLRVEEIPASKYDAPLIALGLRPLAAYFRLWQSHNTEVLEAVPKERLLIVKTQEIIETIPKMAEWLGVPADSLKVDKAWLFAAPKKHRTLSRLDPVYVRETADAICGTLLRQYFPGTTLPLVVGGG